MIGTPMQTAPRRARVVPALVPSTLNFRRFAVLTCIAVVSALIIPSLGPLREPALVGIFFGLCAKLFTAIVRRQVTLAWGVIAFMCATEPAFRAYAPVLPYMALDYVLLAAGVVMFALSRPRKYAQLIPAVAYGTYIALEITGMLWSDSFEEARGIVLPSILMLVFVLNSCRTRFTPSATTFVLACYIAGAVTLTGFALRAYLSGHITWGTQSNTEASGGMPPNHISVLFSLAVFACILLSEDAKRIQQIILLSTATVLGALMVLTFSRGGTVIVLGALVLYYIVLRQTNRRTFFVLIAIAIMALLISYGTRHITGGKIADRYAQANTSNRLTIAVEGWSIFTEHPFLGVGTANFREAITQTEFGRVTGAHNELVRAAAEHGTIGLLTWVLFIASAFVAALRSGEAHRGRRGLRVVILIFATTSMFYNGLKLTVQPMMILLALSAFTALDPAREPRKRITAP